MTSDFSDFDSRIQAARAELGEVITQAQEDLARFRRENKPTEEERQALQDAALRGELGEEMRELARRVSTGRDTWEAIFSGDSSSSALLQGHLDRMAEQNRTAISTALEEDPDFDPFPPDGALN